MLKVTDEQYKLLKEYLPKIDEYIESDDIDELLSELDFAIVDYGFEHGQKQLNPVGQELQRAYDIIHREN